MGKTALEGEASLGQALLESEGERPVQQQPRSRAAG